MILLKKNVIVKKQTLKINDKEYEVFDCDNHEIKRENENLRSQLIFRKVKYEDIEDLNHVLEKFNLYKTSVIKQRGEMSLDNSLE